MLATPSRPPRASSARALPGGVLRRRVLRGLVLRRVALAVLGGGAGVAIAPRGAAAQATSDSLVTLSEGCPLDGGVSSPAPPAKDTARAVRPDSAGHPALVLRAAVSAREIRFTGQPRVVVRLCGAVGDSVRVVERRNLPSPVVVGTTYRDVYVAVEILGHLDGQCLAAQLTGARPDSSARDARCAFLTTRSSDR